MKTGVVIISLVFLLGLFLVFSMTSWAGREQGVITPARVTLDAIPVCYDFGCKHRSVVNLPPTEWAGVVGWFEPVAETAVQEPNKSSEQSAGWKS